MDYTAIVISLISGLFAIVSTIVASRSSLSVSKLREENINFIELQKIELEKARIRLESQKVLIDSRNREMIEIKKGIRDFWTALQEMKEALRKRNGGVRYDGDIFYSLISKKNEEIDTIYMHVGPLVPESFRLALHSCKNNIDNLFRQVQEDQSFAFSDRHIDMITDAQQEITFFLNHSFQE